LYKFLIRQGALQRFIYNSVKERPGERIATSRQDLLDFLDKHGISNAFTWSNTPEGHKYWMRLNDMHVLGYKRIVASMY
jgi:hypothetical protein